MNSTPYYVFDTDEFAKRAAMIKAALGNIHLCFSIKANTKNYLITPCSWNIPLRISTERSTCSLVCVAIRA